MYLICGLGNPGQKYSKTRHNMGFITADMIAEKLGIKINKIKFKALVGEGTLAGEKVVLLKPQTFMNASGEAVREAMAFYKVPEENLLVIFDDIDIPQGDIRVRAFGSAGTHNGMRSVIYQLQTDRFPRIRVGIGSPENSEMDLVDHVIGKISPEEESRLNEACQRACEAACCYMEQGIDMAMNRYNLPKKQDA